MTADKTAERAERLRLRFDAEVVGTEGRVGTLRQVLLDPDGRCVVGLGIRTGFFAVLRVALERVLSATEDEIRLSLTAEEARGLRRKQAKLRRGDGPAGLPGLVLADTPRVMGMDGLAGHAAQLLVDATTGAIEEIVVLSGLLTPQGRRLPAEWVRRITGAGVEVDATRGAVAGLPLYRGDRELRADILDAWFYDDRLRQTFLRAPLDVKVREGAATLLGYAPSSRSRLRLEERAISVPGVLKIRCEIVTDDELVHAAAEALGGDPRTRVLRPRVRASLGLIFLEGEAPDREVRDAASGVAASVPRARGVVNRLRVEGDRGSPVPSRLLHPRVGQRVYTRDGRFGEVSRVLLNAWDRLLAGIVVRRGLPAPEEDGPGSRSGDGPERERRVMVPSGWIASSARDVALRVGYAEAAALPDYREGAFDAPEEGWGPPFPYEREEVLLVRSREEAPAGGPLPGAPPAPARLDREPERVRVEPAGAVPARARESQPA